MGVEQQVADDWLAIRAANNLPLTKTALDCIVVEIEKAGMVLAAGLRLSCERGWAGFKASWLANLDDQRQATVGGRNVINEKSNFSHLDRSGEELAMRASMAHHGIVLLADGEEIDI